MKHGATMYPRIRCLISKHDICGLKVGTTLISHVMDEVFKSYKCQYSVYAEFSEKRKRREALAKLDECVSTPNLYIQNRNGGV